MQVAKKKQKLTKDDIKKLQAMQYCEGAFERMESNKATDRHRQEATALTTDTISDDLDYKTCSILLRLNCLTPEENALIQDALQAYDEGKVDEAEYELIDKMITDSDLTKLEQMFKGSNNKNRR